METQISKKASLLIWALFASLLSQNLVSCSPSFQDQKTYYNSPPPTDPHSGSPPSGSHHTPSHGGTPPANCGTPPTHHHHHPTPTPPSGGGGYHYSPPTHVTPTPPSGGGYHYAPPTVTPTPTTPVITPSPPTVIYPPTTPIDPGTPSTPVYSSPPFSIPTPPFSIPTPPFSIPTPPFDPNTPPFTCDYWRNHPGLIWGVFGFWGTTVTGAFGVTSLPGLGSHLSLQQALSNTRNDGFGELYRQGTASLLNSMIYNGFHFTPTQVRDHFLSALTSNKAAASQARLFKLANEGRLKPRA